MHMRWAKACASCVVCSSACTIAERAGRARRATQDTAAQGPAQAPQARETGGDPDTEPASWARTGTETLAQHVNEPSPGAGLNLTFTSQTPPDFSILQAVSQDSPRQENSPGTYSGSTRTWEDGTLTAHSIMYLCGVAGAEEGGRLGTSTRRIGKAIWREAAWRIAEKAGNTTRQRTAWNAMLYQVTKALPKRL
eukprot:scaffold7147_cov130-Isochrysis_galbana.AAC.16